MHEKDCEALVAKNPLDCLSATLEGEPGPVDALEQSVCHVLVAEQVFSLRLARTLVVPASALQGLRSSNGNVELEWLFAGSWEFSVRVVGCAPVACDRQFV